MTLHIEIDAQKLNPQPNPTPVIPANGVSTAPFVESSVLDNPGVSPVPVLGSSVPVPGTQDPAFIITTADARATYQWPDGSWRQYPVNLQSENLAYGTGPLYQNAGGFGGPVNNPGTNQSSPFNPAVAQH